MSELAILVPVLNRPQNVEPLLASIRASTPGCYRVMFLVDEADTAELEAVRAAAERDPNVHRTVGPLEGNYAQKINLGVRLTDEPFIFCGADDLRFHPRWYEAAKARMSDKVGVVSTADLCNGRNARGELATHPLVARWYVEQHGTIDEVGKVLHEGYPHEYCDQELTETAKHRGAYAFAPDSIVEHLHPDVGKAPTDDLYEARPGRMRQGYRLYRRRRHLWGMT